MADVVLHFTDAQYQQIEILAEQRGYEALEAYIFSLIVKDAQKRLDEMAQEAPPAQPQPEEPAPDSFESSFRQAMHNLLKERSEPEDL